MYGNVLHCYSLRSIQNDNEETTNSTVILNKPKAQ
jgi:hypothetical protein